MEAILNKPTARIGRKYPRPSILFGEIKHHSNDILQTSLTQRELDRAESDAMKIENDRLMQENFELRQHAQKLQLYLDEANDKVRSLLTREVRNA